MTQTDQTNKLPVADFGPGHPFTGMPVIHTYTRAQAFEDGVLVDVTDLARERGFRWDIALTEALWRKLVIAGNDEEETTAQPQFVKRTCQVLNCLLMAIKATGDKRDDCVWFTALTDAGHEKAWAKSHPDDDGRTPCITVMLVGED